MRRNERRSMMLAALPLVIAAGGSTSLAQIAASYTGPNDGAYNAAGNWNINAVPVNAGGNTYNVTIPANIDVNFNVPGASAINRLTYGAGTTTFDINAGCSLMVNSIAILPGWTRANGAGAALLATGPGTSISGGAFWAQNGGMIQLGGSSYADANVFNQSAFYAQGTGSTITASGLQSITNSANPGTFQLEADRGLISMGSLTTVTGPTTSGASIRFWARNENGRIDIPALTQIQNNGWLRVDNGGVINAGSLSTLVNDFVEVYAPGSALNTPPIMNIDGSAFHVHSGGQYMIAANSYSSTGAFNHLAFRVNSGGAMLEAGSLQSINVPNAVGTFQIEADGGDIHLGGLTTVVAPITSGHSVRFRARGPGGNIHIGELQEITNNGWFRVENGGTIHAGGLQSLENDLVEVDGPGSMFNTGAIMDVDGAAFRVYNGGMYHLHAQTYTSTGAFNQLAFLAAGSGGMLHAPGLQALNVPEPVGTFQIEADSGMIHFPALMTLVAPPINGHSVRFWARNANALIELPALQQIMNNGWLRVENGGVINAPALNSLVGDFVEVYGPGSAINTPPVMDIDGAAIHARNGGVYTTHATAYASLGAFNHAAFNAQGGNAVLDLSSIQTLNVPVPIGTFQIDASIGTVNFGGLTTVNAPTVNGHAVRFWARAAGQINLPVLPRITNNGWFRVEGGGVINTPALTTLEGTFLEVFGAGSSFNSPPIMNINGAAFHVRTGATYAIQATDYVHLGLFNQLAFQAQDAGSLLNLDTLRNLTATGSIGTLQVEANQSAHIRFRDLANVTGPAVPGHAIRFRAQNSGTVEIPANVIFSGGIAYSAELGGTVRTLSNALASGGMNITNGGTLLASGDVRFAGNGTILTGGIIHMNGAANRVRILEVGGRDAGLPGDLTNNVRLGTLIVGAPGIATQVRLDDCFDNGRRGPGGQAEALYLTGIDGGDGLVLQGGASLEIGDIPTYVFLSGAWVRLNDMIKGDGCVSFQGGQICGTACKADWDRNGIINSADFFAFLTDFFTNNADFNCDLGTNSADFFSFLTAFFAGC